MKLRNLAFVPITAALVGFAAPAAADSFQGSFWGLSYSGSPLADSDPLHETFRITLGVDLAGYTGGGSFLDQVSLKVSPSVFAASLVSAPVALADWTLQSGGINASGCSGNGGGFNCANSTLSLNGGKGVAVGNPSQHSWVFDITVNNGALITSVLGDSVKGRFVDSGGNKVGALVSEAMTLHTTTPTPEPEIYAMLLAGFSVLGFAARRRKQKEAAAA